MAIKLKSFEQFVTGMDRAEEIEQELTDVSTPEDMSPEEAEEDAESVQADEDEIEEEYESEEGEDDDDSEEDEDDDEDDSEEDDDEEEIEEGNAFGDAVRKAKEAGETEFEFEGETYKVEESEVNENKYAKKATLGYNDQFLTKRMSLAKTLSKELGMTKEFTGPFIGFDYVDMYMIGPKGGTILSGALSGEYSYADLLDAAKEYMQKNKINESEEATEEVVESSCSEMLEKCYESACVKEAKAYEEDAHDEHTIESYMKENAALVAGLMAKTLKEMKEDYAVEAYEAACNEMVEAYSKKMDEMKEMDSVEDAEDVE